MKYSHLVDKLFQWTAKQAVTQIDSIYRQQGFAIVSYVYGAVIVRNNLLKFSCLKMTKWQEALFWSSIILPDGAALRTWRRVAHWLGRVVWVSHLSNLNGTDLFPQLLEYYLTQWPINLVCYAVYDEHLGLSKGFLLNRAGEWLEEHYWINWTYAQDTYYTNDDVNDWNWEAMRAACNPDYPTIMMVCRGVPRQEIWSYENREQLQKHGIIACNQWATIDYRAWRESRAPRLVRKLRLESVWRLISDPRKNRSKFWVSFRMMGEIMKLFIEKFEDRMKIGWR